MTTGGERNGLAPVTPLFATGSHRDQVPDDDDAGPDDGYDACGAIERDIAERNLLRKLRTRSLSMREAQAVVAERDLDSAAIDSVLTDFVRRGYLDDRALAEQLVRAGTGRKGQGRQVLARTLAKRGIDRAVADAAIAELPDDDYQRALAFAQSRVSAMRGVDPQAALRRLAGQLSRRGYPGSVAFKAAREALDELRPSR